MNSLNKSLEPDTWLKVLLGVLIALSACQPAVNPDAFAGCAYTEPEPVFNENLPGVIDYSFQPGIKESNEQVKFDDGLNLNIRQSGCDHLKQEYIFEIPGNYTSRNTQYWVRQTVLLLKELSKLGPEYVVFEHWSLAIERAGGKINLSQNTEIEEGFYVSLDRDLFSDHATLMLTLSDQP